MKKEMILLDTIGISRHSGLTWETIDPNGDSRGGTESDKLGGEVIKLWAEIVDTRRQSMTPAKRRTRA